MKSRKPPILDIIGALNPLHQSVDVIVVDRGVGKIVVAERSTTKRALADVVELVANGLTISGHRVDIQKIVLRGNDAKPRRMYTYTVKTRKVA